VQETFLRAWQKRATYEGRASFRAWLYRIATNACLDFLEKHRRQIAESELRANGDGHRLPLHVSWLQPYPDRLLDQVAPREAEGDAQVIAKETIELAFLIALQFLPARQRAALILCDVLDCSASEAASLLGMSVPSVNGSLRRARATMRERQSWNGAATLRSRSDARERALLEEYVAANERCDVQGLAKLLRDDVKWSMPPVQEVLAGRDTVVGSWVQGGFGEPPYDDWKCVITRANRMPP
jgi:RNA polymerase sigma-70 factor (ECF subfamily)